MHTFRLILILLVLSSTSAWADNGFFAGGALGNVSLDEDFDGFLVDDNATSFRLYAGWRFSRHFALEAGYLDFGDLEDEIIVDTVLTSASLSADGFTFALRGEAPLTERFSLTGRAGIFFWNGTAEINAVSQASPDDTNAFLAAGLRYRISDRFALTGEAGRYELEDTRADTYLLGFEVSF